MLRVVMCLRINWIIYKDKAYFIYPEDGDDVKDITVKYNETNKNKVFIT